MSTCAAGHLPPGSLAARRGRRWYTLLGQRGGVDRPQWREPAGVGRRAFLRRQHEASADAPSEEGARRCFEARWRRGAGAASTPCSGRMATAIAPNSVSPRARASAPCSGGTRAQRGCNRRFAKVSCSFRERTAAAVGSASLCHEDWHRAEQGLPFISHWPL